MKAQFKSDVQIAAEKREMDELAQRILTKTNTIPPKVLQDGSYQKAVAFKDHAMQARKAAEAQRPTLAKLQAAWSLISGYYA